MPLFGRTEDPSQRHIDSADKQKLEPTLTSTLQREIQAKIRPVRYQLGFVVRREYPWQRQCMFATLSQIPLLWGPRIVMVGG